jgi:hypothetical protein
MGNQTIGQCACAALSVLAVLGCAPGGEADQGDLATEQSTLVAALPAFPYDSLPVEIKNVATNKCLDSQGPDNPSPAAQRTCSGTKSQTWFLIKSGIGYQLRAGHAGWRLLEVPGASTADVALQLFGYDGVGTNATFAFDDAAGGGAYQIKTFASNKCVEVMNADSSDTAVIRQTGCVLQDKQRWRLNPRYVNFSFVTKKALPAAPNEHLCMDVANASQDNWAQVQQWWCAEGAAHQRWYLQPSATAGYYSIKSTNSNRCLDVPNASTASGVQLQQFDCHGGNNQLWSLTSQSDGRVEIKNKNSGLCVTVSGNAAINGAVVQGSCSGDGPRWFYTHVVRRHVQLVPVASGVNQGSATDEQVNWQLERVKSVYEQWGVNLLYDPAADRAPTLQSTHLVLNLRSNNPQTSDTCSAGNIFSGTAWQCADMFADWTWPSKVVIYVPPDTTGGGFSGGDRHWIKSMLIPGSEVCDVSGQPDVYDRKHWAHEFGHYMGLAHTFTGDNDLLSDTKSDPGGINYCLAPRSPTNPAGTIDTDNIMSYYDNLSHRITPLQAQAVRQTAFARWY